MTVVSWLSKGSMSTASPLPMRKMAQNMVRKVRSSLNGREAGWLTCREREEGRRRHLLAEEELRVGVGGVLLVVDVGDHLDEAAHARLVVQVEVVEAEEEAAEEHEEYADELEDVLRGREKA